MISSRSFEQTNDKKDVTRMVFVYTILFLFTSLLVFGCFAVYGKTLIYNDDAFYQHYPLLVKLRHVVGDLIRGNGFSFWSQDIGLGNDTLGCMALVMTDPYNYIAAAFPVKYIDVGYSFAVILKIYTAGLTMMVFLKYHLFPIKYIIVGALSYAFCSWAIGASVRHAFFLVPLILFPLVILGIDKVFNKEKPYILIVSVFLSFITYIYFAYMTAIFAFIYVLIKYWMQNARFGKSVLDFFKTLVIFAFYVLIAACLAAPIVVSVVYTIVNSMKTSGVELTVFLSLKYFLRLIPSFISNGEVFGHYSYLGSNALIVMAVPLMIKKMMGKRIRIPSVMFLFALVMLLFPVWSSFMNGFSYAAGRWCYVLSFFCVWAAVDCLAIMREIGETEKKCVMIWIAILFALLFIGRVFSAAIPKMNFNIGVCNLLFILLFLYHINCKPIKLYGLIVFNIGVSYILMFSPYISDSLGSFLDIGQAYEAYSNSVLRAANDIDDEDYWRVDYSDHKNANQENKSYMVSPSNENLFWESRTLTNYLSSTGEDLLSYNKMLNNNGGYYRRVCTLSNDNRSRLNFLQGVKYFLNEKEENSGNYAGYGYEMYESKEGVSIQKSKYDVSLGYGFSDVLSMEEFNKMDSLSKEQALMQCVVLDSEDIDELNLSEIQNEDIDVETNVLNYKVAEDSEVKLNDNKFTIDQENNELKILLSEDQNSELYIEFSNLEKKPVKIDKLRELSIGLDEESNKYEKCKFNMDYLSYIPYQNFLIEVSKGDITKTIEYRDGDPQGLTDKKDFLVNLGFYDKIDGEVVINFKTLGEYSYDDIKIYTVSQTEFDKQAKGLVKQRFTMTDQTADTIKGTVDMEKAGMLYLSILYHPGWTVYVDGVETDVYKTDVCFMGIPVEGGTHEIVLKYQPIGYRACIVLFIMGIILSCILIVILKCKKRSNETR